MTKTLLLSASSLALMAGGVSHSAIGQEAALESAGFEEIVIIGSRREGRAPLEAAVPIDVISSDQLKVTPSTDLKDVMQRVAPSFSVERDAVGDQVSFVRSASLRGLDMGEVLVLLNGKRVHRSSVLVTGVQHADLSQYPSSGLSSIQVLRDGASAQYGADAVAGVINMVMKNDEGVEAFARWGQHYAGDGADLVLGTNVGLPLGQSGFLNITAEYLDGEPTDRSLPHPSAQRHIDEQFPGYEEVPLHAPYGMVGRENYKIAWNGSVEIKDSMELYFFGNWADSRYDEPFSYRSGLPAGQPGYSSRYNPTGLTAEELGLEYAYLEGWSIRDTFPGGYTPNFKGHIKDLGVFVGLKGELDNGLAWDLSVSSGRNRLDLDIDNTVNASFGEAENGDVQTAFYLGAQINQESAVNLDFTFPWDVAGFASPVNVAFGAEVRRDTYEIVGGEEASYAIGPLTDMRSGSDGFQGYSPIQVTKDSRHNYALYLDLDADLTEDFNVGVAARYEDFSDFGSTFNWKISSRYDVTPTVAIRAGVSTGFHAPTVAQSTTFSVSTSFDPGVTGSQQRGVFPPGHPVAVLFGGVPLVPEKSLNLSAGLVLRPSDTFSVTIDAYRITLDDRITRSANFDRSNSANADEYAALDALNIPGASFITRVNYYTNVYDTRTTGVDVVASKDFTFDNGDTLNLSLGYAYTDTKVTNVDEINALPYPPLGEEDIHDRETDISPHKGNVSAVYSTGKWALSPRARFFSTQHEWIGSRGPVRNPARVYFDLDVAYSVSENVTLSVGADNIFNTYPKDVGLDPGRGRRYLDGFPWQGGFYYFKVSSSF